MMGLDAIRDGHEVKLWIQDPKRRHEIFEGLIEKVDDYKTALDWCDFVFIDADHTYEGCLADIRAYLPKVKIGGVIARVAVEEGQTVHAGELLDGVLDFDLQFRQAKVLPQSAIGPVVNAG